MRTLCAFFLLCLAQLTAMAQTLHPACQVGAKWYYVYIYADGVGNVTTGLQTITCTKDTSIKGEPFSVLEADSGPGEFFRYSYLAMDSSKGLYFYAGTYFPEYKDSILFSMLFDQRDSFPDTFMVNTVMTGPATGNAFMQKVQLNQILKHKIYTNGDSATVFLPYIKNGSYGWTHEKYLSIDYGPSGFHTRYFGIPDIEDYVGIPEVDYMALSCYSDSSGTVKFIKQYLNKSCDYVTVPEIIPESELYALFPSPASDKVFIASFEGFEPEQIDITDLTGKTVISKQVTGMNRSTIEIDLNDLTGGVYFCWIKSRNRTISKKLVIAPRE